MNTSPEADGVSLRISVTDRCSLRCLYCMEEDGIPPDQRCAIMSYEEMVRFVRHLRRFHRIDKIRLTGGDPLARTDVERLVAMLAAEQPGDLALTTNGQLLAEKAASLKAAGLRRVNISLNSLREDVFRRICRGGTLERTREGIAAALRAGLAPVKLNMVVLRDINDNELTDILRFALELKCEARFIELMPIGIAAPLLERRQLSSAEMLERLSGVFRVEPAPTVSGETGRRYFAEGSGGLRGRFGLIPSYTDPFCHGCRRLRLTSDGHLLGCLARGEGVYIRPCLQQNDEESGNALGKLLEEAFEHKRAGIRFERRRSMVSIGG